MMETKAVNFEFWYWCHSDELSGKTTDEVIDIFISQSIFCGIEDDARRRLRDYINCDRKMSKARKGLKEW